MKQTLKDLIESQHPFSVPVQALTQMTGMRKAVWDGRTLFVSHAMQSLLRDEGSIEIAAEAIEVVYIPRLDVFDLPMLSLPPV